MRKVFSMVIWIAMGVAMWVFGHYIGSRQERSAAAVVDAREVMAVRTLLGENRQGEAIQRIDALIDSYSARLDTLKEGRGLNPEHRDLVRIAREEIRHYRAEHP